MEPDSEPDAPTGDPLTRALTENSPATSRTEPHLRAVIGGAIATPGKLIRAGLALSAGKAHGLALEEALQLACGIEYLHLASLILDDLPCMDDAETRLGEPCAHRRHGEASAILGALALINRSNALFGLAFARQPGFVRLQAAASVDACLGPAGLIGGQARDLRFGESDRSARTIGRIAAMKTPPLFWLAVYLPALPSSPSARERRALKALCLYWGLAFQAVDDLGRVLLGNQAARKSSGRDRGVVRPNLALALGVSAVRARIARLRSLAGGTVEFLVTADRKRWGYLEEFQKSFFVVRTAEAVRAA